MGIGKQLALLIHDPDHQNAKQVLSVLIWHKTQNKKMMHYLNKQNFCVSYMDLGKQSKKLENNVLMERVVLHPYWRESLHIAAAIMSMRNPTPYPCLLANSNLFQPSVQESTCCFNDAAMCKSVEKSHPGLNEGISPCSIGKLKAHPRSLIL